MMPNNGICKETKATQLILNDETNQSALFDKRAIIIITVDPP